MSTWRWNIFVADLNPVVGSEQGKHPPVLVISDEEMNRLLPVVVILPITTRKEGRPVYPNEVLLTPDATGLRNESLLLYYQIRTPDKSRLSPQPVASIQMPDLRAQVLDALAFQLAINSVA